MDYFKLLEDGFESGKLNYLTDRQITYALHVNPGRKRQLKTALNKLCDEAKIIKLGNGKYLSPKEAKVFKGTLVCKNSSANFIVPEGFKEKEHDYYVLKRHLHGALDGDEVLAVPIPGGDEAHIVKILRRGKKTVVGRYTMFAREAEVVPDDRGYNAKVLIHHSLSLNAEEGDKVVAEIVRYGSDTVNGKIIKILGRNGELETEEDAIIYSANLKTDFPAEVELAANEAAKAPVYLDGEEDLRDILTVTIDGEDTRDIDDAVSLSFKRGKYVLGVHIADVSRYVKPKSCLDEEAYARGTSVYFPDRVLPMLPKALSNGACSLNEGEDRYALSCIMTFDKSGKKHGFKIVNSVIRSDRRMTYDEVTSILEDETVAKSYGEIGEMLKKMAELCLILEARRIKLGEVPLDIKEAKIYLDERGEIVIPEYERKLAHRMIEQFMISANETVATFAESKKAPFLYRVHEKPATEKAELLLSFAKGLGMRANFNCEDVRPKDYQKIINAADGKPYETVVHKVMLRSMQKARYCEKNLKHFGLASDCYCHFTSPIRRYPDLVVHRILKLLISGKDDEAEKAFKHFVVLAAASTSESEKKADLTERDVDDLYKAAYMQKHIGETYPATVSGVSEKEIFAELTNTVEGHINYRCLPGDDYEYIPEKFLLKGKKHSFSIGDNIFIRVDYSELVGGRIGFSLADGETIK